MDKKRFAHIRFYYRRTNLMIFTFIQGRYDLCGLRCVYGRCNAISKFRNLGSNQVRVFFFSFSLAVLKY